MPAPGAVASVAACGTDLPPDVVTRLDAAWQKFGGRYNDRFLEVLRREIFVSLQLSSYAKQQRLQSYIDCALGLAPPG